MDKFRFGISNMTNLSGKWATRDHQLKIHLTMKSISKSILSQEKMSTMRRANDQAVKSISITLDHQVLDPLPIK